MSSASDQSQCANISGLGKYQYIVYAILGSGVIASEWLGLTKYVKPNTIVEAVIWITKNFVMNGGHKSDKSLAPINRPIKNDEESAKPNENVHANAREEVVSIVLSSK